MKKTFIYCAIALMMASLTACNDFLTVDQKGKATIPSFLSDPRGLNAGLIGAYNTFYDYYDNQFLKYPEVAGNMSSMNLSSGSDMLEQYNFTPNATSATTSYYIWYRIGVALANANNIIQYAPAVAKDYPTQTDSINHILGQALLLRALCHFDLCRVYAQPYNYTSDASHLGIPVLTKTPGPDDNPARSTVKQVYDQILVDLTQASSLLSDNVAKDVHYASLQAVNAMFARVYLYMEDWSNALKYAQLAIGSQTLAQGSDYYNMYMNLNTRGEAIFRLSGDDMSGKQMSFYATECLPADTLISLFDSNDVRLPLIQQNGAKKCIKYTATTVPDNQTKREDPFIFRLSEMYLTAAEAAWESKSYGDAKTYIEAIISRAVGTEKASTILAAYSDNTLINLIRTERVKELCFEGHNFFDITRWKQDLVREKNTNSTVSHIAYPSDLFVLPIPQYELDANENMQPNPTVNK
jgi:tetratricopeptide (TPR) repeat protein